MRERVKLDGEKLREYLAAYDGDPYECRAPGCARRIGPDGWIETVFLVYHNYDYGTEYDEEYQTGRCGQHRDVVESRPECRHNEVDEADDAEVCLVCGSVIGDTQEVKS